jgi:hypothetical protein
MILGRKIPLILHEDNQASKLKAMNRTHKLSIAAIHESIRDLGLELRYTESGISSLIFSLRCYQGPNLWTQSRNSGLGLFHSPSNFQGGQPAPLRGP